MSKNQFTGTATQPQCNRKFCQCNKDQYYKSVNWAVGSGLQNLALISLVLYIVTKTYCFQSIQCYFDYDARKYCIIAECIIESPG